MSGEIPKTRDARDRFEKRLREQGYSSKDARDKAIKHAVRSDRRQREQGK
jgi:hypothetical protein